jgi:hypothetical protein
MMALYLDVVQAMAVRTPYETRAHRLSSMRRGSRSSSNGGTAASRRSGGASTRRRATRIGIEFPAASAPPSVAICCF